MPAHKNITSFSKGDPRITGIKHSSESIMKRSIKLRKRIEIYCNYCGKHIEIIPSILFNLKHHFCNRICYKTWQKETNWFNKRNQKFTIEGRKILSEKMKGIKNPRHKSWQKMSEIERDKWIQEMRNKQNIRPTKPEKQLMKIINIYQLPYKYVGDGIFWIKNINPDFINVNGEKIIIEIHGDYWHNREDIKKIDMKKSNILKQFGWSQIIIWEHELKTKSPQEIVAMIEQGGNYAPATFP